MKYLFTITLLILLITAVSSCKSRTADPASMALPTLSADDQKSITQREISTWEFGKTKNFAGLKDILADDYMAFFGKTTMNKNDVVRTYQNSIVKAYHLSNIRLKPIADDVAIIYYDLDQDVMDENGDKWTPFVSSSSTYVKRGGAWRSVFYQETPIQQ